MSQSSSSRNSMSSNHYDSDDQPYQQGSGSAQSSSEGEDSLTLITQDALPPASLEEIFTTDELHTMHLTEIAKVPLTKNIATDEMIDFCESFPHFTAGTLTKKMVNKVVGMKESERLMPGRSYSGVDASKVCEECVKLFTANDLSKRYYHILCACQYFILLRRVESKFPFNNMAACDALLCLLWLRPYPFHHLIWASIMEKRKRHVVQVQKDAKKIHVYFSIILLWLKNLRSRLTEIPKDVGQPSSMKRNTFTPVRKKLPVKRAQVKGNALEDIRALPIGDQGYAAAKGTHPPSSSRTHARKKAPNPQVRTHHSASYNRPTPPPSPPTISTPHASPPIQIPSPRMSPSIQPHHTPIHAPPIPIPPIPPPMPLPSSSSPTILVTPASSHTHSTSTQPIHSSTPQLAPCSSTYALPALENIHIANLHARNTLESLSLLHDYHEGISSFMGEANQQVLQLHRQIADLEDRNKQLEQNNQELKEENEKLRKEATFYKDIHDKAKTLFMEAQNAP
ncbi:hypothetical protein KP509_26G047500 [Ceratopteris richardii]|uniref:Uncharacterized protein n=1 Tax=Ceratopteris richardii TaxID=49495 RepID=A0A8T2RN29_CERRI|nr:hypothetical protein KP509_26G047500 [Ceratopteris richardii]